MAERLGGLAWYDDHLDITWAVDANISGVNTWDNQVAWAAGLTIGGVSGWRLPNMDVNGDGTVVNCFSSGVSSCADNEMGYLYWKEGITTAAPGPFSNVLGANYWSGTVYAPNPGAAAWNLDYLQGFQGQASKGTNLFAWAVRSGDVSVVPLPAAAWLFGSGLIGLLGVARRRKAAPA